VEGGRIAPCQAESEQHRERTVTTYGIVARVACAFAREGEAFEEIAGDALTKIPLGICAFSVLSNHCYSVVWLEEEG
jgi:hypothetical protein